LDYPDDGDDRTLTFLVSSLLFDCDGYDDADADVAVPIVVLMPPLLSLLLS
jgi:hypothetical protein